MLFSIIVPVYRVEDYLRVCVDSLISQSFEDYEVILVDDGSPDSCPEICENYARKDPRRIKVIHQPNQGLSSARNTGIKESNGDYLIFLDSDDLLKNDALERIGVALAEKPDVLITQMYNTTSPNNLPVGDSLFEVEERSTNKNEALKYVFSESRYTWASPQYIVNRDFILRNKLTFELGFYHEDVDWTSRLFAKAQTFQFFNGRWYERRLDRAGSITNTFSEKRVLDALTLIVKQFHSNWYDELSEDLKALIFQRLDASLFGTIRYYKNLSSSAKKEYLRLFSENYSDIELYANKPGYRIFGKASRILGLTLCLNLTSLMKR